MLITMVHCETVMTGTLAAVARGEVRNVHVGLDVAVGGVLDETEEMGELPEHAAVPFYLLIEAMCPLKL